MTTKQRESIAKNDGLLVALVRAHAQLLRRQEEERHASFGKFGRALRAKMNAAFLDSATLAKHLNRNVISLGALMDGKPWADGLLTAEEASAAEKFIAAAWKKVAKP